MFHFKGSKNYWMQDPFMNSKLIFKKMILSVFICRIKHGTSSKHFSIIKWPKSIVKKFGIKSWTVIFMIYFRPRDWRRRGDNHCLQIPAASSHSSYHSSGFTVRKINYFLQFILDAGRNKNQVFKIESEDICCCLQARSNRFSWETQSKPITILKRK